MTDLTLVAVQIRHSLRGFLRDPRALILTVIMPVFLLLLFNAIFHGMTIFAGRAVPAATYYTASIVAYQTMMAGFTTVIIAVTTARERGLLKRFRGTPMPSWVYLAAEIGRTVIVTAVTVCVLVGVGVTFYHVQLSANVVVGLEVYVVAGTASFCALGLAVIRFCPTTDTATAIGPFSTVILSFISGVFVPVAILPPWLLGIGKAFPLEHLAAGLQAAFIVPGSNGISVEHLGSLLAWGVLGLVVAVRTFRWEPLATGS